MCQLILFGCASKNISDGNKFVIIFTILLEKCYFYLIFYFSINRFEPSRLHKKTSFTILNELEPNQSRPQSPSGGRAPFRGKGFRTNSSMRQRPVSCPESPKNATNDSNMSSHDDLQLHRPSVRFNIMPIPRKRTTIKVLGKKHDDDGNQDSILDFSYQDRDMESFEMLSNGQLLTNNTSAHSSVHSMYPSESPRTKPSPAPRRYIQRSASTLHKPEPDEDDILLSTPVINPRSYHKGLLRVVSTSNIPSPPKTSRIPRRKSSTSTVSDFGSSAISPPRKNSFTASADRLHMRRDSSVSPKRRKNSIIGGSMIDLGVSTPSRSTNRISKPTTLSPIVGTPNKDFEQESSSDGNDAAGKKYLNDSPTKIPIRRSSSVNITGNRLNVKSGSQKSLNRDSQNSSKASTKSKPLTTKIPQKMNQKGSPSKVAKKVDNDNSHKNAKSGQSKDATSAAKDDQKASSKKELPATLKRQPSNIKRESSQQTLRRENSTMGSKQLKTKSETLSKNQSDSSLAKRLEKKNSFKQKRRTSSESDGLNEIATANISDKLIPLTKQNGTAMTTALIASQPVQITAAVTDQLTKTNSTGQIVNNGNFNTNSDNNNNEINKSSDVNLKDANSSDKTNKNDDNNNNNTGNTKDEKATTTAITSEAAATTADTVASTNVDANKEPTMDAAAAIAKSNEKEMSAIGASDSNATDARSLQKQSSTRTLGSKSNASVLDPSIVVDVIDEKSQHQIDIDMPTTTAIETKVNVADSIVNNSADSNNLLKASDANDAHHNDHSMTMIESTGAVHGSNVNQKADNVGQDNNGIGSHMDSSSGVKNQM